MAFRIVLQRKLRVAGDRSQQASDHNEQHRSKIDTCRSELRRRVEDLIPEGRSLEPRYGTCFTKPYFVISDHHAQSCASLCVLFRRLRPNIVVKEVRIETAVKPVSAPVAAWGTAWAVFAEPLNRWSQIQSSWHSEQRGLFMATRREGTTKRPGAAL